jgi:hypothetical protein
MRQFSHKYLSIDRCYLNVRKYQSKHTLLGYFDTLYHERVILDIFMYMVFSSGFNKSLKY